ncbi:MAG: hypothetical protein OXC62_16725 [Aestuariivita sp.]|nr:hypothetical protein [Aestuariivita sp.]
MSKHLFLIHGRNFKPNQKALSDNWLNAIKHGLQRKNVISKFKNVMNDFKNAKKTFVYYGDLSNRLLKAHNLSYDEARDISNRMTCLKKLKTYKKFDKKNYKKLPGAGSVLDDLARIFNRPADAFDIFGVIPQLIGLFAPDMKDYWEERNFAMDARARLTKPLSNALINGDDVCLVAHSLGSIISYDVLWKFSHYGEYQELRKSKPKKVTFITIGSPLGNETVKRYLKGSDKKGAKYPSLVRKWDNFAAEDDYISHDQTLANDYRGMLTNITDHHIYNLAVRNRKSNPHHSTGYLIHPEFIGVLAPWL